MAENPSSSPANGIAFGPDRNLYVSATVSGWVYRYRWDDGKVGPREAFGDVINPELGEGFRGPDGMAFGQDGNLYVTVARQGDVTVLGSDGTVVRRIALVGPAPTNVAFGPPGSRKIYVTEQGIGLLEVHDVETDGLPLLCAQRVPQGGYGGGSPDAAERIRHGLGVRSGFP